MNLFFEQLHFLRPNWLWAILLVLPLIALLWRQHKNTGQWQNLISPELLPFLLEGKTIKTSRSHLFALMLVWIISSIALAGPSWQKLPVAVEKNSNAMVIILDLSPSMLTEDIKPSRIVRARLKIVDLLRERPDGQTALLVYGADAHVVTPLTEDSKTISNLLPMLSPTLMPTQGSNTEAAVERALQLLHDAGLHQGDLLLISDGVTKDAQKTITEKLSSETGIRLSILGVGGLTPAPIPSRNGGFLRDKQNNIVTSFLDAQDLNQFALKNRGRYKTLSTNVSDIHAFTQLPEIKIEKDDAKTETVNRTFDQWTDEGHWLVLLLIPIALYAFRRGTLAIILIMPFICMTPQPSYAMDWNGLWKNQNQQAYEKLQAEKPDEAAKAFTQPDWKASAEYRAGNFAESAKQFATDNTAKGRYNYGNALAKSGQLAEAIKAYDQALKLDPELKDAENNRKIVEDALKKQQEQNQQQNKDQNKQDKNKQDQNQQNKDQQDKNQQQQDQQNQDQQSQDQKDQQQKEQEQKEQQQKDQQQSKDQSQQQNGQNSSSGQNSSEQNESMQNSENSSASNQSAMNQQQQQEQMASSSTGSQAAAKSKDQEEKSEEEKQKEAKALAEMQKDGLTDEERKNLEQWLRRVQDDPSGLLRRKFEYESKKRNFEKYNGTWEAPNNEADQRL